MAARRLFIVVGVAAALLAALFGWMFVQARALPIIRSTVVILPYPADVPRTPIRVALITDTHLSGPDNSPARLARTFDLVNAQRPDLILLGGDYVSRDKPFGQIYRDEDTIKPFARLHAPLGVFAVLGNHDISRFTHDTNERIKGAFRDLGVPLLENQAVRRGPLVIGGVPDLHKGRADIAAVLAAMRRLGGAPILLSHTADAMEHTKGWRGLILSGHSHCGQVALPYFGALYVPADTGTRYACGRYDEGGRTLIVSGGVGTSGLPLRFFAPADVWIVTIRPR